MKTIAFSLNRGKVGVSRANFPVRLNISGASGENQIDLSGIFIDLPGATDWRKIAVFTSYGRTCYIEVEQWEPANNRAILWVSAPTASIWANSRFELRYDPTWNNSAYIGLPGSIPAKKVWPLNDWDAVYHYANDFSDSTANAHNAVTIAGGVNPTFYDSPIGRGLMFNGINQGIQLPDHAHLSPAAMGGQIFISFWYDVTTLNFYRPDTGALKDHVNWLGKGGVAAGGAEYVFSFGSLDGFEGRGTYIALYAFNPSGGWGQGAGSQRNYNIGDKIRVVGWIDVSQNKVFGRVYFPDGTIITRSNDLITPTENIVLQKGTAPVVIGGRYDDSENGWFKGGLHQLRYSRIFSEAEDKANYYSESDQLVIYGQGGTSMQVFENFTEHTGNTNFGGANVRGQKIRITTAHTVESVFLKMRRIAAPIGDVIVALHALDPVTGLPTGAPLCFGTRLAGSIVTSPADELTPTVEFLMSLDGSGNAPFYEAGPGDYALVWYAPDMPDDSFEYRVKTPATIDDYLGLPLVYSANGALIKQQGGNLSVPAITTWGAIDTYRAYFEEWGTPLGPVPTHLLTINTTVGGTTSPAAGTWEVDSGSVVNIQAIPDSGYVFDFWSGDISGTQNPISLLMDGAKTITANFRLAGGPLPTQHTVNIAVVGSGTTNPAAGSYLVDNGTTMVISAIPPAGYVFVGWSGDITAPDNPLSVLVNSDVNITATFEPVVVPPGEVVLTTSIIGNGSINPAPGSYTVVQDSTAEITAVPASGWRFAGWAGDATGTQNPLSVLMDANKSITAVFEEITEPPPPPSASLNTSVIIALAIAASTILAAMIISSNKK